MKKMNNRIDAPAPMATSEVAFSFAASFLYWSEWNFRFCAFVSNSERKKEIEILKNCTSQFCTTKLCSFKLKASKFTLLCKIVMLHTDQD